MSAKPHRWVELCELAQCSPDFDVVYGFSKLVAIGWLWARLDHHGHGHVRALDIEAAYDAWPPKPGGVQ